MVKYAMKVGDKVQAPIWMSNSWIETKTALGLFGQQNVHLPIVEPGFQVYAAVEIEDKRVTAMKVGFCTVGGARGRINSFRTGNWRDFRLVSLISAAGPKCEAAAHRLLAPFWITREWFRVTNESVATMVLLQRSREPILHASARKRDKT